MMMCMNAAMLELCERSVTLDPDRPGEKTTARIEALH